MKRKIGIDCFKCSNSESTYYANEPGKCKVFSSDSPYDKIYNYGTKDCDNCDGLGLVYSYETLGWFQSILHWIIK